jgi:hypothetical protein
LALERIEHDSLLLGTGKLESHPTALRSARMIRMDSASLRIATLHSNIETYPLMNRWQNA